jgi:Ca-activated chloride channel family protein
MSGEKIERAKDAAIEALRRLGSADIFSLVMYDHNVETVVPAQSAANSEWIEARIRRIQAGGNTALFGGVSQGASEVRKHMTERYIHRIILLSDGLANVGPSSPEELGRLGSALIKEGIAVTTVGVGTDYNEDLMTRLSQNSDGNSYFAKNSRDLPDIFAKELGDVLNVAAKRIRIVIEFDGDVIPVEIIGREGRIRGRTVEISLNQLYGGLEKFALVKVQVPAGRSGTSRDIAVARVLYEDALDNAEATAGARVSARFSSDSSEVARSVNVTVQRHYVFNMDAIAQDDAIAKADQGKLKEATLALRDSARQLKEAAVALKDASLKGRAEEVEAQAAQIEREGMSTANRKTLRTDSYQLRNQQIAR